MKKGSPLLIVEMYMSSVKITIGSTMSAEPKGKYEFVAYGEMTEVNGTWYVRYNETAATGMEGTKTTLKWRDDMVTIMRHGTYQHRQEHRPGLSSHSTYTTPYFSLPLATDTKSVNITHDGKKWQLLVTYDIALGGRPQGNVVLDIRIEEEESSGN